MIRSLGCSLAAIALSLALAGNAAAFSARGSVEQVYATGLSPGAQVSLLDPDGKVVATRTQTTSAARCSRRHAGGRLPRQRGGETSDPLTVLTQQSAPPSPTSTTRRSPPTATAI